MTAQIRAQGRAEITTLENGVRVVTERIDNVASAALGVWFGAGARHESATQNGAAHFLEHMAFKGTASRTARQIAEEIEDVGGYLNAYTSRESTAYYARVLAEDAPLAFSILADILRDPLFAAEDVETERGVILQEIGQTLDTPDDVVFDWAQETSYPDQPIGRPILGSVGNVSGFDAAALRGFMTGAYGAEATVIAAAGAVEHAETLAMAERAFGDLPRRPAATSPKALYQGGERREVKTLEQAHVVLAFEAPGYHDDAFFVSQVYSTLLGGGMSSRLFQEAREMRGLCYSIFSQLAHYRDTGALTVYAGTGGEQTRELLEVIVDEMRRTAEAAGEAEVARARAQIRAGLLMGLESTSARCERLARSLLSFDRVRSIDELVEKIEAVDVAAVRDFAGRLITAAAPTLTLYGPVGAAPSLDQLRGRLAA